MPFPLKDLGGWLAGDGLSPVIVRRHHYGVDGGVARLRALKGGLEQIVGAHGLSPHEVGEADPATIWPTGIRLRSKIFT